MPEDVIEGEMLPATRPAAQVGFGVHALPPQQLVEKATEMARVLTNVIRDQKLYKSIQGRNFVVCEGWTTAGAMLGFIPGIAWTKQDPDRPGVYISEAVLTDMRTGLIICRANAECGDPDEKDRNGEPMWSSRAAYARRSMSETRAVSKVCRIALSWVVKMAGFDPTPAEEVPDGGFDGKAEPEIPASVQPTQPPVQSQAPTGELFVKGAVEAVSEKTGENKGMPWTKYGIKIGDIWYNSFDHTLGALAKRAKANKFEVELYYQKAEYKGKEQFNVADIVPVGMAEADDENVPF